MSEPIISRSMLCNMSLTMAGSRPDSHFWRSENAQSFSSAEAASLRLLLLYAGLGWPEVERYMPELSHR